MPEDKINITQEEFETLYTITDKISTEPETITETPQEIIATEYEQTITDTDATYIQDNSESDITETLEW
jgi:hypothetical protein